MSQNGGPPRDTALADLQAQTTALQGEMAEIKAILQALTTRLTASDPAPPPPPPPPPATASAPAPSPPAAGTSSQALGGGSAPADAALITGSTPANPSTAAPPPASQVLQGASTGNDSQSTVVQQHARFDRARLDPSLLMESPPFREAVATSLKRDVPPHLPCFSRPMNPNPPMFMSTPARGRDVSESLISHRPMGGTGHTATLGPSTTIDPICFRASDFPLFKGKFGDVAAYRIWRDQVKSLFIVKNITLDNDKFFVLPLLLATDPAASWCRRARSTFMGQSWNDVMSEMELVVLPAAGLRRRSRRLGSWL